MAIKEFKLPYDNYDQTWCTHFEDLKSAEKYAKEIESQSKDIEIHHVTNEEPIRKYRVVFNDKKGDNNGY